MGFYGILTGLRWYFKQSDLLWLMENVHWPPERWIICGARQWPVYPCFAVVKWQRRNSCNVRVSWMCCVVTNFVYAIPILLFNPYHHLVPSSSTIIFISNSRMTLCTRDHLQDPVHSRWVTRLKSCNSKQKCEFKAQPYIRRNLSTQVQNATISGIYSHIIYNLYVQPA